MPGRRRRPLDGGLPQCQVGFCQQFAGTYTGAAPGARAARPGSRSASHRATTTPDRPLPRARQARPRLAGGVARGLSAGLFRADAVTRCAGARAATRGRQAAQAGGVFDGTRRRSPAARPTATRASTSQSTVPGAAGGRSRRSTRTRSPGGAGRTALPAVRRPPRRRERGGATAGAVMLVLAAVLLLGLAWIAAHAPVARRLRPHAPDRRRSPARGRRVDDWHQAISPPRAAARSAPHGERTETRAEAEHATRAWRIVGMRPARPRRVRGTGDGRCLPPDRAAAPGRPVVRAAQPDRQDAPQPDDLEDQVDGARRSEVGRRVRSAMTPARPALAQSRASDDRRPARALAPDRPGCIAPGRALRLRARSPRRGGSGHAATCRRRRASCGRRRRCPGSRPCRPGGCCAR